MIGIILVATAPFLSYAQTSCPTLSVGSSGSGVTALQTFFVNAYSNFPQSDVTGYFGHITQAAVEEWQSDHNIVSSGTPATTGWGVVGPRTRTAMGLPCTSNPIPARTTAITSSSTSQSLIQSLLAQLSALEAKLAVQTSSTSSQPVSVSGGGNGGGGGGGPPPVPAPPPSNTSCTFNGQTIPSGQSITGYQSASVPTGQQCVSHQLLCTNGTLSNVSSYPYASCTVQGTSSCSFNGQTVANGQSVTAYQASSVPSGQQCTSQSRICSSGTLSGTYQYTSCSVSQPLPPLIGAFRWDGWFPNVQTIFPQYYPSNFFTAWSYREPTYGWFDADTPGAQAIMDQEILDAANHGLDFWVFDDYKYMEDVPQLVGNQAQLYDAYTEYLASPNKSHLKFALWTSPGVTSAGGYIPNYWRSTYLPYLIKTFQDPQYLKVDGNRPVLFMEGSGSSPSDIDLNFGATNWPVEHAYLNQQAEAAGLGDPVIIQTDADTATAKADALDGVSTYGVMGNGATPTSGCTAETGNPTPHCPFSSQMTKDESNWTAAAQSGLPAVVPGLTANDDPRALTSPYGFYVDQPTYTQWQQEVKDAFTFMVNNRSKETSPPIAVIYAWDELGEGGPGIIPTKQNGTMFLDAINAVKTANYPSTYQDTYNGDNDLIVRTGNWVNYTPVPGNFNNDEEISEAYGDTATLSADNATAFKVVGTNGPNEGVMQVYVDGVSQGVITRTQTTWSQDAVVFQSASLPAGTHTLKIVNVYTDASAPYVGIDYIVVSH